MTRIIMGTYHPEDEDLQNMANHTPDKVLIKILTDNPCTTTDLLHEIAAFQLKVPLAKVYVYAPPMRLQKPLRERLDYLVFVGKIKSKRLGTASGPWIYWRSA